MELPLYAQGQPPQGKGLAETMSHFMPLNYRELSEFLFISPLFFAASFSSISLFFYFFGSRSCSKIKLTSTNSVFPPNQQSITLKKKKHPQLYSISTDASSPTLFPVTH